MNYSVYFVSPDSSSSDVLMLNNSSLENAIAFASYLFVNTGHSYFVKDENFVTVVGYYKVR